MHPSLIHLIPSPTSLTHAEVVELVLSAKSVSGAPGAPALFSKELEAENGAVVLKTGLTPSASGSAYFELEQPLLAQPSFQTPATPKLICTVHGPRPLPSSAPFTSSVALSAYVKFASFATWRRRGYLRDAVERDLAMHVEAALRGAVVTDRWPKSGIDVVITILETEDEVRSEVEQVDDEGWTLMSLLSGCITVASTALLDAGIDCVDVVSGGAAALVQNSPKGSGTRSEDISDPELVWDPSPTEHSDITAACVVGYLGSRDEVAEMWVKRGTHLSRLSAFNGAGEIDLLIEGAVGAAAAMQPLIVKAVEERA